MARSRGQEIAVGVLMVAALAVLGWMAVRVGALGALGPRVHVTLRLADAAGLQAGAVVAVAGVPVGEVERLALDGDTAVAALALDPGAGVRSGVAARVRARSLLGEKYVELVPGAPDAPPLTDGAVLVADRPQVEIDELLATLGPALDEIDLAAVGRALGRLADALDRDPERLARVLERLDVLLDRGAEAAEGLPAVVDHADATLTRVDGAVGALDRRLAELKAPLARADAALARLEDLPLEATVDDARATLDAVRGAASDARDALGDLDGLDADLRRVLANVAEIDKWELRRLLREEGILIRVHPREVTPTP